MAVSAAPAAVLTLVPFETPSADIAEVTLTAEDAAAISSLLETTKLELAILRHRVEELEHANADALVRDDHLNEQLSQAVQDREQIAAALQKREHRMWSGETRGHGCECQARTAEERANAAETREWEAKARLVRVRAALDEPVSP